jgi:hypothetical protein
MPIAYYIIPMVPGPYSRENPQDPAYVFEIRCNWTGHNIDQFGVFVCKVNTTPAKHADLESRPGVWKFPEDGLNTVISTLHAATRNRISNKLGQIGLPYYEDETLKDLIQRVIVAGVLEWGNADRYTTLDDMPGNSQARTSNIFSKWGWAYNGTDTLEQLLNTCKNDFWNPEAYPVREF